MSARIREVTSHLRNQWMGALALFLVLTGGSAYALSGTNSVFTDDIAPKNVNRSDVALDAINSSRIAPNAVQPSDVANPGARGIAQPSTFATANRCQVEPGMFCATDINNRWGQPGGFPTLGYGGYFLDSEGFVHLQGHVQRVGNPGNIMFTLPRALGPSGLGNDGELNFVTYAQGGSTGVEVAVDDTAPQDVEIRCPDGCGSGAVVGLSGISWRTN